MIKEWATVVSWQNGIALVSCDVKASCNSCASRAGCGSRVLNKLGPQTSHTISVPSEQPLVAGQKVELGITEGSLLSSAMLVYLSRWWGCLSWAAFSDAVWYRRGRHVRCSFGWCRGFWLAKGISPKLAARDEWQPVILSVALAPDQLRVETLSSEAR